MAKKNNVPEIVVKVLRDAGVDPKTSVWDCHGTWVVLHNALEVVAAKMNVVFDQPQVIETNAEKKIAVICVTGKLDKRVEWSIGEATPANNKNAYPYAMAEKRAKDRVILKLVGLHGYAYSEEEADDFKDARPSGSTVSASEPEPEETPQWVADFIEAVSGAETVEFLNQLVLDHTTDLGHLDASTKAQARAAVSQAKARLAKEAA